MRALVYLLLVAAVAAPRLAAQSLADRVSAVKDGTVEMTYASRPDACGDGRDVVALGRLVTVYPSMRGHGWSDMNCTFGPARSVVTIRDGEIANVRTHIAGSRRGTAATTDLGVVPARAAAEYFLTVASSAAGRAASSAVMAAAIADSVDIWRRLLTLARDENRPPDVRSTALYWMSGVAPPEAAEQLATLARTTSESRSFREGVIMTLSQLRNGAGVPALIAFTQRDADTRWMRERAMFWLGNSNDDRARRTLRTLASADTLAIDLRDQAIFALGFLDKEGENGPFLRELYARLESNRLKDKVIQSIAQLEEPADQRWLANLVLDAGQPADLRRQALFWRGQNRSVALGDLIDLYPRLDSRNLREHYVFVLSQRHESAAVDKLIDLARNDSDREIRRKAVFWLGQSKDPRATKFLEERISQ